MRDPWYWQRLARSQPITSLRRRVILMCIAERAAVDTGECFVSQEDLACEALCDPRTVREHLKGLEADGYLRRFRRSRGDGSRAADGFALLLRADKTSGRDTPPTGDPGGGLPEVQASGELPQVNGPSLSPQEESGRAGAREAAQEPLVRDELDERAEKFAVWHAAQVHAAQGQPGPPPGLPKAGKARETTLARARKLCAERPRQELKDVVEWAMTRPYWVNRVRTMPLLAQHFPTLRAEWAAAKQSSSGRGKTRAADREQRSDRRRAALDRLTGGGYTGREQE